MRAFLALGSNLGDKEGYINKAIEEIKKRVGDVLARSSFFYSKPQGFVSDNDFVNAVISVETSLTARELLLLTQQIERELGRKKKTSATKKRSYSDRTIDIDILLYGDEKIDEHDLQIPHPRMKERDFVMVPLREIITL